ncbi:MAG TPA: CstA-like transporter-associated (seleno)protein [Terriglobia bacterium]|nr:CstA-like transporter-associated (seleno)protein [Terriglobia bacterium]
MTLMLKLLKTLWTYLREVSGENDYARYRGRVAAEGGDPVTRQEFYDQRLQEKYSRPNRCC